MNDTVLTNYLCYLNYEKILSKSRDRLSLLYFHNYIIYLIKIF